MLVKFFKHGSNNANSCVDYLIGRDRLREDADILRGDPNQTIAITESSQFAKKYTSGCLSFEETDISTEQKQELMDGFEECLLSGLDRNQYDCLWIEHRDKGRLELNFVIPNIELTTGKRLQPYYHEADNFRVEAWRDIQNIEYGFSAPDDPSRRQVSSFSKDLPKDKQEAKEAITSGLMTLIDGGVVRNREELIEALESNGFEVARAVKQSISIKDPDGGRNIRLTGAIYEQDFRFSESLSSQIESRTYQYRNSSEERLRAVSEKYQRGIEAKRAFNTQRYKSAPEQLGEVGKQALQSDVWRDCRDHSVNDSSELVLRLENIVTSIRSQRTECDNQVNGTENQWGSTWELQSSRWEDNNLREDRPEAARIRQEPRIQSDSEINDDRDRTSIIEHIKRIGEAARERTERFIEKAQRHKSAEYGDKRGESSLKERLGRLELNIISINKKINKLEMQQNANYREKRDIGFDR